MADGNVNLNVGGNHNVVINNSVNIPAYFNPVPPGAQGLNTNGLGAFQFDIAYDATNLTYNSAVWDSTLIADGYALKINPTSGDITFNGMGFNSPFHLSIAQNLIVTLNFTAGSKPGTYTLTPTWTGVDDSTATPIPYSVTSGNIVVTGDPHFTSYRGEKFHFHGEPNKIYNLFSDSRFQVNSSFGYWLTSYANNFTYMQEIGIKFANLKIKVDAAIQKVTINDIVLEKATFGGLGFMEILDKIPERFMSMTSQEGFGTFLKGVLINILGHEIFITISTDHVNPIYLNLSTNIKGIKDAHGVVGQTAMYKGEPRTAKGRNGEGIVEGEAKDYEVSELFADNFKFNKWSAHQMIRVVSAVPSTVPIAQAA